MRAPGRWLGAGLAALWLSAGSVLALDPSHSLFQYNLQTWRKQNGLTADIVKAVAQTRDGYLWLGTSSGLVRFDGAEFKHMLADESGQGRSMIVTGLARSRRNGLWVSMEQGGVGFFDGSKLSFWDAEEWEGDLKKVHAVLEAGNGDVWIASENMAGRLIRGERFEAFPHDDFDVIALCEDSRGRVWLGTSLNGLYWWKDGMFNRLPDPDLNSLTVSSIIEDHEGRIWVGTQMGLLCYDAELNRRPLPFPWYPTLALLCDSHGTVWVGTGGGGLVRYEGDTFMRLQKSDGLAEDFVTALAEDEEGSLWVGTRNGLSQLSDVRFPTLSKAEGLPGDINVAVTPSHAGGLWVASERGFTHFNEGAARSYTNGVGLRNDYINGLFEASNGDLYLINGVRDIEVFSGSRIVARHENQVWPTAFVEDEQGVVVALGGTLHRVGTNPPTPYEFADGQHPPLNWIFTMAKGRDGCIWVASGDGLCRVQDGRYRMWTAEEGLPATKLLWVCEDDEGIVWVGSESGIGRLKDGKATAIRSADGLFDDLIYAIVPDDRGYLWMDSSRGIFRVERRSLNAFAEGKADRVRSEAFDGPDSVKSTEKFQQKYSGCRTSDGHIWFPTAQGVVRIDPARVETRALPPRVRIHLTRANGRELESRTAGTVEPGAGELEFHYAGLSYVAPGKIRYRYRLEGYDGDWVEAGPRRSAFYTNLKPGRYRFQVQARSGDGPWNQEGDSASVELLPHYYQTAWFRAVMVVAAIKLVLLVFGWRMRSLRRRSEGLQRTRDLLDREVRERTASLAESNEALRREIEVRKEMQFEVERTHRQLVDISRQAGMAEVATSVLHNVGNVLNSVNTSASVIAGRLKNSKASGITRLSAMLEEHRGNLADFLAQEGRADQVIRYLNSLAAHLSGEQSELLREVKELSGNIEHIKEIVVMQQSYAKVAGVVESVNPTDLVEDSLRMNSGALNRHGVEIVRDFADVPAITVEKHKVLQILVNLIRNAKYACDDSPEPNKRMRLVVRNGGDRVRISVEDNGVGIPPENMARIFNLGFTTRKQGHGFGLHSGAIAAREMGGALLVHSDGPGRGARFTLELPIQREPCPMDSRIESHAPRGRPVLRAQPEIVRSVRGKEGE